MNERETAVVLDYILSKIIERGKGEFILEYSRANELKRVSNPQAAQILHKAFNVARSVLYHEVNLQANEQTIH